MAADRPATRALVRLDADVARSIARRDRIVLSFSGGLGSLLVAAVARKRCDLRCVVVGLRGAADVEAATVAQKFLDYPVAVLRPTAERAWTVARTIRSLHPRLPLAEVLAMVPLALVEERHPHDPVLTGFGLTARTPSMRRALGSEIAWSPGLHLRISRSSRVPLLRMAVDAGLPESFSRAAPRSPLEGSGLGPVLRALARSRKVSFERLLSLDARPDQSLRRPADRPDPKTPDVDEQR
jgi:hypothetical protein